MSNLIKCPECRCTIEVQDTEFIPSRASRMPDVCEHGGLRRQCNTCELQAERDAALREVDEQARLLGMGSEREAGLMAEVERLRDALAHFATDETPEGWIAIAALEGK